MESIRICILLICVWTSACIWNRRSWLVWSRAIVVALGDTGQSTHWCAVVRRATTDLLSKGSLYATTWRMSQTKTDANVQRLGLLLLKWFHPFGVSLDIFSSNHVVDKHIPSKLKYHMAWSQFHNPKKVVGGIIQSLEISYVPFESPRPGVLITMS